MADSVAAAVPFINAASTAVGAAASGYSMIKGANQKMPRAVDAPKIAPIATAPSTDDAAILKARRDAILRRQSASGRASTQLTDNEDKLG